MHFDPHRLTDALRSFLEATDEVDILTIRIKRAVEIREQAEERLAAAVDTLTPMLAKLPSGHALQYGDHVFTIDDEGIMARKLLVVDDVYPREARVFHLPAGVPLIPVNGISEKIGQGAR